MYRRDLCGGFALFCLFCCRLDGSDQVPLETRRVICGSFSVDGTRFATGGRGKVIVVDFKKGKSETESITLGAKETANGVWFVDNNALLISASSGTVYRYDLSKQERETVYHADVSITSSLLLRKRKMLVLATAEGTVFLNLGNFKKTRHISNGLVLHLSACPLGQRVISSNDDREVTLIDIEAMATSTFRENTKSKGAGYMLSSFSSSGKMFCLLGKHLYMFPTGDLRTEPVRLDPPKCAYMQVGFVDDDRGVCLAGDQGKIALVNLAEKSTRYVETKVPFAWFCTFSEDRVVVGGDAEFLEMWSTERFLAP